ncbi:hypothetical protein T492DRAFT_1110688 [Pavlovales sp. CCMP2436]|nr:hypothetical protein T492DRAFT_1110688 [Pavlovales sp. CCMP2436]
MQMCAQQLCYVSVLLFDRCHLFCIVPQSAKLIGAGLSTNSTRPVIPTAPAISTANSSLATARSLFCPHAAEAARTLAHTRLLPHPLCPCPVCSC